MCKSIKREIPHEKDSIINDLLIRKQELSSIINDPLNFTDAERIQAAEDIKEASYQIRYNRDIRGKCIAKIKRAMR